MRIIVAVSVFLVAIVIMALGLFGTVGDVQSAKDILEPFGNGWPGLAAALVMIAVFVIAVWPEIHRTQSALMLSRYVMRSKDLGPMK